MKAKREFLVQKFSYESQNPWIEHLCCRAHLDFVFEKVVGKIQKKGAVQKEMDSPDYFKFTSEFESAKI